MIAFMAVLNGLQINNPLSAKICHLDCLFRTTVPNCEHGIILLGQISFSTQHREGQSDI